MTRVSVVIPTYQRAANLPGLIAAFEAQTLPVEAFEVIVADDASTDGTPAVLEDLARRTPINLRILRNDRNRGPAATRNLAWRSSEAPIIAFTDDDCTPQPKWLEAGLAGFESNSTGIVQGRTIPDPTAPKKGWAKTLLIDELSNLYQSCNIFYRSDLLRAAGGFDDEIAVPFGEDTALGWKARRLGAVAQFAREALVYHSVTHPGLRHWWRYAMMHRNFPLLVRKFPEMRKEMLWLRVFIWRDHAVYDAALAGLAAGALWPPAFVLILPYAYLRRPRKLSSHDIKIAFSHAAMDTGILAGLLVGSIRERTLVL